MLHLWGMLLVHLQKIQVYDLLWLTATLKVYKLLLQAQLSNTEKVSNSIWTLVSKWSLLKSEGDVNKSHETFIVHRDKLLFTF